MSISVARFRETMYLRTMNTTQTTVTEIHPLNRLTAEERAGVLAQLEALPKAEREHMAAAGLTVVWMRGAAEHVISWRGLE